MSSKDVPQMPSTANGYRSLQRQGRSYLPAPRGDSPRPVKTCHRCHQLLTDTGNYRDKDGVIYLPPEETAHTQKDTPQPLVSCQFLCLEGQATKLHDHHLTKHTYTFRHNPFTNNPLHVCMCPHACVCVCACAFVCVYVCTHVQACVCAHVYECVNE